MPVVPAHSSEAVEHGMDAPRVDAPPLDDLYRAHARRVAGWVAHLGGPSADVDDLVHDVFLIAGKQLADFRGDSTVATWLFGITHNVVRAHRRKERFRSWLRRVRRGDLEEALSASAGSALQQLESQRARGSVYRILDQLPEKYREVLILYELQELPGEEIARLTGRKLNTVWVHLHRARAQFLACMKQQEAGQ